MKTIRLSLVLVAMAGSFSISCAETRTFIDQSGRPLEGEFISASGGKVTIKRSSDGQTFTLSTASLSKADQAYIAGKSSAVAIAPSSLGAAYPLQLATGATAPAPAKQTSSSSGPPFRVELKVYPNKNDKAKGGYYDERIQRISYRIDVRSGEQQRVFDVGKVIMFGVAKGLEDTDEMQVVVKEEMPVSLKALGTQSFDTKETKLTYDDAYFKGGFKYSGYVCVLKDQSGKTVAVSGSTPALEKNVDQLLQLKVGDVYDKSFKLVANRPLRNF